MLCLARQDCVHALSALPPDLQCAACHGFVHADCSILTAAGAVMCGPCDIAAGDSATAAADAADPATNWETNPLPQDFSTFPTCACALFALTLHSALCLSRFAQ